MPNSKEIIDGKRNAIDSILSSSEIINSISSPYFIVDRDMRIRHCNNAFLNSIDTYDIKELDGKSHEDVIDCINMAMMDENTNPNRCKICSFRGTIEKAYDAKAVVEEEVCITRSNNRMNSYKVTVTPFEKNGELYAGVSFFETSVQKRKDLVDSVFFHDLINLAGSLSGYLEVVSSFEAEEVMEHIPNMKKIADQILNEIMSRRQIDKAEQYLLDAEKDDVSIMDIMKDLNNKISSDPVSKGKNIEINIPGHDFNIETDQRLIEIVLFNMLINALEAIKMGGNVILDLEYDDDYVVFSVNNDGVIDDEIKENIFVYGFTTKGRGRGSGTYGMKLLGENYLNGEVWFETNQKKGTTFYFKIPIKFKEHQTER